MLHLRLTVILPEEYNVALKRKLYFIYLVDETYLYSTIFFMKTNNTLYNLNKTLFRVVLY